MNGKQAKRIRKAAKYVMEQFPDLYKDRVIKHKPRLSRFPLLDADGLYRLRVVTPSPTVISGARQAKKDMKKLKGGLTNG